jgi:hypothetical protein
VYSFEPLSQPPKLTIFILFYTIQTNVGYIAFLQKTDRNEATKKALNRQALKTSYCDALRANIHAARRAYCFSRCELSATLFSVFE